ncbi:MAG: sigma-70 family RNA polymerase sigma factor [Bacteroidales bacterium]|nr:sigma-70 family RNA polymerase sigma factor [Bacteroidales bacterium]
MPCSFFANCYVIMGVRTKDPFEEMLHRYRGLLFTLCSRFRHRGLDTDDLIQEATIALWRARERLFALKGAPQAALTWKIARNAVVDTLRRIEDNEALPESYDQREEDHSLVEELHEVIAQLEEPDRTIVRMKLEGYSYKEISQHVELSEKNVSVRLVRVKEKLKKEMTK